MAMKLNTLLWYVVISTMLVGCENFLEEDPKGLISDNYALTEKGAESELLSLYQINTELLDYLYMVGELGNDLMAYGGNTRENWRGMINYDESYMKDTSEFNESIQ